MEKAASAIEGFPDFSVLRCQLVTNTAMNLRRRYEYGREIDGMVLAWTICLGATSQSRRKEGVCAAIYNGMSWATRVCFSISSEIGFLDQAVSAYQLATNLPLDDAHCLANRGCLLRAHHSIRGRDNDLDMSIDLLQQTVGMSFGASVDDLT